jgi:nicotinamidase/pyrazinamidase
MRTINPIADLRVDPVITAVGAVDAQKGFMPGTLPGFGELPAPEGDQVAAPLAALAGLSRVFFATGDGHTVGHTSFKAQGGPWDPHCVLDTPGAELHPLIAAALTPGWMFHKGVGDTVDAYSAFEVTDLAARLRAAGIRVLIIGGLVTNVCVLATVTDALREGFVVIVVADACRGIQAPGLPTHDEALEHMRQAGAVITTSTELLLANATPQLIAAA